MDFSNWVVLSCLNLSPELAQGTCPSYSASLSLSSSAGNVKMIPNTPHHLGEDENERVSKALRSVSGAAGSQCVLLLFFGFFQISRTHHGALWTVFSNHNRQNTLTVADTIMSTSISQNG